MDKHSSTAAGPGDDGTQSPPLAFLLGPTASGKTALSLAVAQRAGAEILSADSMLVYRGMDIGTAKPGPAERAACRHHLIDLVEPSERFSAQDWLAAARAVLQELQQPSSADQAPRRALFVGGTAFYVQLLTVGLFEGPPIDPELRAGLQLRAAQEGAERLHADLERVDAASAARIHPNDTRRVVRALEVQQQTGRALSDWQREWGWHAPSGPPAPRRIACLRLEPETLEQRIRARTQTMLESGWVEEARALRETVGFGPTAIQALGYREVLALADGEASYDVTCERVALRTRQFARKQRTWLRRFEDRVEIDAPRDAGDAETARAAQQVLAALGWD